MALERNKGLQASNGFAVTPSDTAKLGTNPEGYALYVGVTGNIVVDLISSGTQITFSNVPVGFFPVMVSKVWATNTTATNMVALS
jgi:hypothetical protein